MLLNRSASVLWQSPQHRFLLSKTFYALKYNNYRENRHKYEYRQTRNYKDFGHTRKKNTFRSYVTILVPSIGMFISTCIGWER